MAYSNTNVTIIIVQNKFTINLHINIKHIEQLIIAAYA